MTDNLFAPPARTQTLAQRVGFQLVQLRAVADRLEALATEDGYLDLVELRGKVCAAAGDVARTSCPPDPRLAALWRVAPELAELVRTEAITVDEAVVLFRHRNALESS